MTTPIHEGQPLHTRGIELDQARCVMIMIHGRGASPHYILALADEFETQHFAYLAPQAAGFTWYPNWFTAPIASNEPYLSSALRVVDGLVEKVMQAGIPSERVILLGFSQGACLTLEYAARHARRYGGVIGLSGGLIGEPGQVFSYPGSLMGTPVFLGCSDIDRHIPLWRVHESAAAFKALEADVTERIYPNMGHLVHSDEIAFVKALAQSIEGRE